MQLVEVRALKPFVGSYRCSLSEADTIEDQLTEKEGGLIIKEKVPRKRFAGWIAVERYATSVEIELAKVGQLPGNLELEPGGKRVTEHPTEATVMVPADIAENLVSRGLAEIVGPKLSRRTKQ